jgi:DNA-binding transcriptional LysR family regulator
VRRYPNIQTRTEVNKWETLIRRLNRDEIKFFVADVQHFEADPGVQTRLLKPRPGLFYYRSGHPLLEKESLSTNDQFNYPLAGTRIPSDVRKLLANLSGKTHVELHVECNHFSLLRQLISASKTIDLSTQEGLAELLANGEFVQLHLRDLPNNLDTLNARCGIVTRAGNRLSPAAKAMIGVVQEMDNVIQPADMAI